MNALAVLPSDTQTLYVSIGHKSFSSFDQNSNLYKSSDGGESWVRILDSTVVNKPNIADIKISPLNPTLILALHRARGPGAGNLDQIFRSTDGGASWKDVSSAAFSRSDHGVRIQIGCDPRDSTRWYATGDTQFDLTFYTSTDAGASWTPKSEIPDGINQKILVDVRDHERIYLIGGLSGVLVSTNGGGNWTIVNELANWSVLKLTQPQKNPNIFLAGTAQGTILKTNDSSRWNRLGDGLPQGRYFDIFVDDVTNYVFTGGEKGLFRIDAITSVPQEPTIIPSEFKLSQNYPNPFNPTTAIHFTLPQSGVASLKVFDMLGRELATLLNEYQIAGARQVNLNASSLTSGVYFYKLESSGATAIRKMLLVK